MEKLIAAFPQNLIDALEIASKVSLKKPENAVHNIVVCGMGGSGIGGGWPRCQTVRETIFPQPHLQAGVC